MRKSISPLCSTFDIPSVPFKDCPAQTFTTAKGECLLGRNVFNHCQIVGHVTKHLLERFPENLRAALFPKGTELVAAIHDIGKINPTFFLQQYQAAGANWKQNYPFLESFALDVENEKNEGYPALTALTLSAENYNQAIQTIAGEHYGFSPSTDLRKADNEAFGGKTWQAERKKLLKALQVEFDTPFPDILSPIQIRTLSGITSVADWIGSGALFDDPSTHWQENIEQALNQAGYEPFKLKLTLTFKDAFGFTPRETQTTLIKACKKPGVYVLEAPMGIGKTEAALFCAYKMLTTKQATGIYFALPSKLTSNKISERFNQFLTTVLSKDCPHRRTLLVHGNAWLEETEMGEAGQHGKSWFNASKRSLLAPFSIGTLDQLLLAAMDVRDGNIRAFGLAGKVVILDEVHSYDTYTSVCLKQLITLLRQLHCTVIILSATLSQARKQELLARPLSAQSYPLITAISAEPNEKIVEIAVTPPPSRNVNVHLLQNSDRALDEALRRAEQGQQVLWIENTVNDAQDRYFNIAARCKKNGVICGLLHSRFLFEDRTVNETLWVNAFGKSGRFARKNQGRIVVGTQVLEQSLDIDADFLISRFAPTDMLLQRLGRLWRHVDTQRPPNARCEAWFLAPTLENALQSPQTHFGASAEVYNEYILCRSLEAWKAHLCEHSMVTLPRNIRPLIDATYFERLENEAMTTLRHHLYEGTAHRKGLNALRQLARTSQESLSDSEAQPRYNQEDTAEILLLQSINIDRIQKQTLITLCSGKILVIPWRRHTLTRQKWRHISATLMRQMVPCKPSQLPQTLPLMRCKELGLDHALYLGDPSLNETIPFAIALTGAGENLSGFEQNLSDKFHYSYRQDTGLNITQK